jgi:hypothetical protein
MTSIGEDLPDFIVGIDFGQTYTGKSALKPERRLESWTHLNIGVVWTNLVNTNPTQSIRDWPGLPPDSVETKVPTKIAYPRHSGEPLWGFDCDFDNEYP